MATGSSDASVKRLLTRLKWNCQCNRYAVEDKVGALAHEILNDWEAMIAFVHDPRLPPTNNDAERALRHAAIARRIGYGTRTDEGRSCYAAALSVIETCRKRSLDMAAYARVPGTARQGLPHPPIRLAQPPATTEGRVQWLPHRRMNASQQIRWSTRGAHLMLKVRTAVVNGRFDRGHACAEWRTRRPFRRVA